MPDNYMDEMKEMYARTLQTGEGKKFSRIICPHTYDTKETKKSCKLCDLCKEVIFDRSKPKNDPLKETAKRLSFRKKYYSNVLFIAKPDEVVLLEYGDKIFNKLIAAQMDDLSEWKNFMHPTQGRNLYITKIKIGPDRKDVDYNVEARMLVTPLPDLRLLTKIYDLNNILAPMELGKIIPTPQSKFDFQKTEIRVLPNGDKTRPLFFYKLVFWHDNLTNEEFNAIQAGKYNPVTGLYLTPSEIVRSDADILSTKRPETSKVISNSDLLAEWGLSEEDIKDETMPKEIEAEGSDEDMEMDLGAEPICFGQYDKSNVVCNGKCLNDGWGEPCKKVYEEKLAIRAKARRLSK